MKEDVQKALEGLTEGHIKDPHTFLGLHKTLEAQKVIRLWRPGVKKLTVELHGETVDAKCVHDSGVFSIDVPVETTVSDYKVHSPIGKLLHDPYAFGSTFDAMDAKLFHNGCHYELYNVMGARVTEHEGCKGVKFALWAPDAKGVSVVGDFNDWDEKVHPMRKMQDSGVWELFIPGLDVGKSYRFEIKTVSDQLLRKSDPYALFGEKRPENASIIWDVDRYKWQDSAWVRNRSAAHFWERPMNIYEVHLGAWKGPEGEFRNYREIAIELAGYCKEMGYTHVELMPISEHPLDESWGYQVTGFFSVTSRYGTPEDFQYFVDTLHQNNIGVFLDWVPGHFPVDGFSLAKFDGKALYEYEDPKKGFHPHWNTLIFDYGRKEVENFLIASALFWFDKMHIDGLRVDAVASMLYLDYGRDGDEWIPNKYGGKENLEAISFLKHLNTIVHERFPGALMIAEESTDFFGISHPAEVGGLGFDLKWNMGWMNDTLRYFQKDPIYRKYHHNELTFTSVYAFNERFMLVLSHDEVVHGKKSMLSKMPGDDWQRFANLRLLYGYMLCHPGKKLLFMGGEFGQWNEWNCKEEIHWHLLNFETHRGIHRCVKKLNHFYLENPTLWEKDFDNSGFQWIDYSDTDQSIVSFLRLGKSEKPLACVCNFTPNYHASYFIPLKDILTIHEVFNTDCEEFGGSNKCNKAIDIVEGGFTIQIPPLSTLIFEVEFE